MDSGVLRHEMVMEEAAPHLSAAFGLCIDKGGKINLLPPKEIFEQKISYLSALVRVLFFLFLIFILSFSWLSYVRCLLIEKDIVARTAEIREFEPHINEVKRYMSMNAHLTGQKNLLEDAVGRQPLWIGVLKELSVAIPDGVILKNLEAKMKGEKMEMKLTGEVFADYRSIEVAFLQFHGMLDESPYFTNVRPTLGNRDVYSPVPKATFEIVCDLVY